MEAFKYSGSADIFTYLWILGVNFEGGDVSESGLLDFAHCLERALAASSGRSDEQIKRKFPNVCSFCYLLQACFEPVPCLLSVALQFLILQSWDKYTCPHCPRSHHSFEAQLVV